MKRLIYLLCFNVLIVACNQEQPKDDFPEFTDEQLNKMLKQSPEYHKAMQEQQQRQNTQSILDKMEQEYQNDSNNIHTAYAYAHQLCTQCVQGHQEHCLKSTELFTKVIEQDPNYKDKKPYYNRMLCYKQLKNYKKALTDLAIFIKHYEQKPIVNHYAMQAELLYLQGDSTKACKVLGAAYQLDSLPFDSLAWHGQCP